MKMTLLLIMGMAVVALAGLAITSCGRPGAWHGDESSWRAERERRISYVKARLADELELTDTQQSELDRMLDELKTRHDEMRAHRPEFKAQFIDTLRQDRLEADDILGLIDTKRPEFEAMLTLAAEKIAEFHNMLTPEQRAKLIS